MRRTTPDLTGSRKAVHRNVSIVLMTLTVLYVLWTNYVMFVGGNLPLTPIDLGDGSTGGGLAMLFVGDLIIVLLVWLFVDNLVLNLVYKVLLTGQSRSGQTVLPEPQPSAQQQGQQGWQQGGWQQPAPQQFGPPQSAAQQPGPSTPSRQGEPYPPSGGGEGRLVGPGSSGWGPPDPNSEQRPR